MRSFDPVRLGAYETQAWVAYYTRRWGRFLVAAVQMVRVGFQLSWLRSVRGAYFVLRANQRWAPYPDNDPEGARADMARFYALVIRAHRVTFDGPRAAQLEIQWWRIHRELQHDADVPGGPQALVDALAALYSHVYQIPVGQLQDAAAHRAAAMEISDAWVAAGADPRSPQVAQERTELIRGYTALRDAVAVGSDRAVPG
jgi:hypothetical protein